MRNDRGVAVFISLVLLVIIGAAAVYTLRKGLEKQAFQTADTNNFKLKLLAQGQAVRVREAVIKNLQAYMNAEPWVPNYPPNDIVPTGGTADILHPPGIEGPNESFIVECYGQGIIDSETACSTDRFKMPKYFRMKYSVRDGNGAVIVYRANFQAQAAGKGAGFMDWSFTIPDTPYALAVADINGDRLNDMLVAQSSNKVAVYFGSGGAFDNYNPNTLAADTVAGGLYYDTGAGPRSISATDFNADGRVDIVTADHDADQISIRLGAAGGVLAAASQTMATGAQPSRVLAVDLNKDGKIDLVTADTGADRVSVFMGVGDGNFLAAAPYATAAGPVAVVAADIDGDSFVDLLTANQSGSISILKGLSSGGFATHSDVGVLSNMSDLAVADFNEDGKLDFVSSAWGPPTKINLHLGNGDGTFQSPQLLGVYDQPGPLFVPDYDGDGHADLFAWYTQSGNQRTLLYEKGLGNGNFSFVSGSAYATPTSGGAFVLGDFDGNGVLDMLYSVENAAVHNFTLSLQDTLAAAPATTNGWKITVTHEDADEASITDAISYIDSQTMH